MKKRPVPSKNETLDALFQGLLAVLQREEGYRFSLDALLLARFVGIRGAAKVMDLGTGNGVIALILAFLHPSVRIAGLELQEEMAARALRNVVLNGFEDRVEIIRGDVRSIQGIFSAETFDAVVCNPPFRRPGSGRVNPDPEKHAARHEITACLGDFLRAGFYLLRREGKMALIYPAARAVDLLQTMRQEGLEPKRLRLVHSFQGGEAALVLAEGIKGGRSGLKILSPLVVYANKKEYSEEMKAILSPPPRGSGEESS